MPLRITEAAVRHGSNLDLVADFSTQRREDAEDAE
jgi:hypothetical protein